MFEILKIELLKNIKKDKIFFILMLLSFSSLIIVFALAMNHLIDGKARLKEYEEAYLNTTYYNLYPDPQFSRKLEVEDRLEDMIDCYNEISKKFVYDDSYNEPIFFKSNMYKGNEKFLDGYEEGRASPDSEYLNLKGYRIGKYFYDIEKPQIESGRYFTQDEFKFLEGDIMPVILGSEYKEIYNIGDTFKVQYSGEKSVEVIGFFRENTFILEENKKVYLDRYISVPSFDIEYKNFDNKEEQSMMEFHYYTKLNGRLLLKNNELERISDFQKILNNHKLYDFYLYNRSESASKVYYSQLESTKIISGLAIIIFIFTFVSLITAMISKVYKNVKKYSIHILIGARPSRVMKFVLFESIIIYFLSILIAIGFLLILNKLGLNPYIFDIRIWITIVVFILVIIMISYYIILNKIKSIGISQLLRRND